MADAAATPTPGEVHLPPISAKAILLGNGPRFARDAFGPVLAFYVLWKLWGLVPGIAAATIVALVAFRYERQQNRPALVVRIALVFVLIQAVVGLWTGSLPDEVKASRTHRRVFGLISLAWGAYMVLRSVLRLLVLAALGVDVFVAVGFVTGFPVTMALMSWSIWYGVRGFRRSAEWGPAIAELEAAALEAEFDAGEEPRETRR